MAIGVSSGFGPRGPRQRGRTAGAGDVLDHDGLPERRSICYGTVRAMQL